MKKKVAQIIKIIGIELTEIIMDIELDTLTVNSIEWVPSENKVYVHIFEDDLDIEMDFDDLSKENQKIILNSLSQLIYN